MVEYIVGIRGSGKTSRMIKKAIDLSKNENNTVVFVDCGNGLNCVLPPNIRLINANDFDIFGAKVLYGFLLGLCAGNYDITDIFVDCALRIIWNKTTDMDDFMNLMSEASIKTGVNFHFAYCNEFTPKIIEECI